MTLRQLHLQSPPSCDCSQGLRHLSILHGLQAAQQVGQCFLGVPVGLVSSRPGCFLLLPGIQSGLRVSFAAELCLLWHGGAYLVGFREFVLAYLAT